MRIFVLGLFLLFLSSCILFTPEEPEFPSGNAAGDTLLQFNQIFESYYSDSATVNLEKLVYSSYEELFKDTSHFFKDYNGIYIKTDRFESRLQTLASQKTVITWSISDNSNDTPAALYKDGRKNIFQNVAFSAQIGAGLFEGIVASITFEYYSGQWYITHWEERANEKSIFHYEYAD